MSIQIQYILTPKHGRALQLPELPVTQDAVIAEEIEDGETVVGILVHDATAENPLVDCEGGGTVHSKHKDAGKESHAKMREALGLNEEWEQAKQGNPYAVVLDCYQHGNVSWSVAGEGMQCPWDTARNAGVWVPDKYCVERITALPTLIKRMVEAKKCARESLEAYNSWLNGDVYGVRVFIFDIKGDIVEDDSCYGYIGKSNAMDELKEQVNSVASYRNKKKQRATLAAEIIESK